MIVNIARGLHMLGGRRSAGGRKPRGKKGHPLLTSAHLSLQKRLAIQERNFKAQLTDIIRLKNPGMQINKIRQLGSNITAKNPALPALMQTLDDAIKSTPNLNLNVKAELEKLHKKAQNLVR